VTVVSVKKQSHLGFSDNKGLEKTATEYYAVTFDAPGTDVQAETATGVPVYGAPHPDDATRIMIHSRAQCIDPDASLRLFWQVQCDYSNVSEAVSNPLTQPAAITWGGSKDKEAYFFDFSNVPQPVVNSAGEPFEKLPERERTRITATFSKNVPGNYSVLNLVAAKDKLNAAPFLFDGVTIPTGQAKICEPKLSEKKTLILSGGGSVIPIIYRVLSLTLEFEDSWDDVFEDRGYNELDNNGDLTPIVSGKPPTAVKKPYPLDGDGGAADDPTTPGAALPYKPYKSVSFGSFGVTLHPSATVSAGSLGKDPVAR